MAKIKAGSRQEYNNRYEMKKTYDAAEWLLRSKMDDVGYLVSKLLYELSTLSVNRETGKKFMYDKLITLLDESVEKHTEKIRTK